MAQDRDHQRQGRRHQRPAEASDAMMAPWVRRAEPGDLARIMAIISQAIEFLRQQGLPQWQKGYGPDQATIAQDLARQEGQVYIVGGEIQGYAVLTGEIDESYAAITAGQWDATQERYIAIHRVALDAGSRGQGMGRMFLQALTALAADMGYRDIRIDTHPENKIMEKAILSAGFAYCGMVQLPIPQGERKAYQLILPAGIKGAD